MFKDSHAGDKGNLLRGEANGNASEDIVKNCKAFDINWRKTEKRDFACFVSSLES